jgi:hypothetical protein
MRFRWPGARIAVPVIVRGGTPHIGGGLRHRSTRLDSSGPGRIDAHTAEAVRAISLARRHGPVWDAYAHCERAPLGWEGRA